MNVVAKIKRREREFPRYKIPLEAVIGGHDVTVADWSVAGLGLAGTTLPLDVGEQHDITVRIRTTARTINLPLTGEIVWVDPAARRAGMQLLDPPEKTAALAELADIYLAGRLKTDGPALAIVDKDMTDQVVGKIAGVEPAKTTSQGFGLGRRLIGLGISVVIGAAAFFFLANIVYNRLFTFDALSANIASDVVSVVLPVDGVVNYASVPDRVKTGEKLADIAGPTPSTVISPCDCYVLMKGQQDATFGRAGKVILSLVRQDAKPYISVRVPFRRLTAVYEGARISLTYLDGVTVGNARILSVPKVTEVTATQLTVNVDPGRPLDPALAGQPVYAKFDTAPWNWNPLRN